MNTFRSLAYFYCAAVLCISAVEAGPILKNGELLEKSGVTHQVMQLPAFLRQSLRRSLRELHHQEGIPVYPEVAEAWDNSALIAFKSEKILASLDEGLERLLTPEEKSELLTFYSSPLGKKIAEANNAVEPEDMAKIEALAQNPASFADRAALYKELDDVTGATRATINQVTIMHSAFLGAFLDGFRADAEGRDRIAIDRAAEEGKDARAAWTQQASAQMTATIAYSLKDLSTDELKAYIKALKTPAGQKFYRGLNELMTGALTAQSKEFGRVLHILIKTLKTDRPD